MSNRFSGRWALVTGAASGIGEATCVALAERGANVWLVDLHEERLQALVERLASTGVQLRSSVVDVADREAMIALAEAVHAEVGALSVLVNNAGYAVIGRAFDTTLDQWERQLAVNLMGVITGAQLFGPKMAAADGPASIVNIASAAGFTGMPMMSAYSVSKAAVITYSQALQAEWDSGVLHVAAVCPGFLQTRIGEDGDFTGEFSEGRKKKRVQRMIAKKGRAPEEVAAAILRGIERKTPIVHIYGESWQLDILSRLLPSRLLDRMKKRTAAQLAR